MTTPRVELGMPFSDYADADGVNATRLKAWAVSALAGKWADEHPMPPSSAMRQGTALHTLAEGEDVYAERVVVVESFDDDRKPDLKNGERPKPTTLATGSHAETWAAAERAHPGKIVVTPEMDAAARRMWEAVSSHPVAGPIMRIKSAKREVSVFWHDPDLDLDCKARLDMVVPGVGLVDLKTTSDITPHGLSGAVAKYAYHMQAAWYVRAAAYSFRRMTSPEFFFVFAESKPPYDVSVRRLGWDAIMQGWAECVDAARRIKAYERTGEAPTASPVPLEIGLPAWAVMRDIEFRDDIPPLLRGVGNEK